MYTLDLKQFFFAINLNVVSFFKDFSTFDFVFI